MRLMQRRIYIVAGPNGAGKTTFARTYLPNEGHFSRFINADLIAAGLSPFRPEAAAIRAGRLMLEEIAECIKDGESFALETTLSGRSYAMQIPKWRAIGYTVDLVFLRLRSVRLAISRVKLRVLQGGHHIPASVVRRRYHLGLQNFHELYCPIVNRWRLYDNSGGSPRLLGMGANE